MNAAAPTAAASTAAALLDALPAALADARAFVGHALDDLRYDARALARATPAGRALERARAALGRGDAGTLRVREARSRADLTRFVRFAEERYAHDPQWVPVPPAVLRDKLTPGRDPFWNDAERALFLAERGGRVVGTLAAVLDHRRLRARNDGTGQFGWFECEDDERAARALVEAAKRWLRARGATALEGPYNPSANDEHGVLVDGFDTRPALLEGHHPRSYAALLESAGLAPLREAYAWLVRPEGANPTAASVLPERVARAAARARANPRVRLRSLDLARWSDEVRAAHALYNRAMATVDAFVPLTEPEFRALCEAFRAFVDPHLVRFVEVDGAPAGLALALPDAYEALHAGRGAWCRPLALYRTWRASKKLTRAVFKVLVIDPAHRARGLEALLIEDVTDTLLAKGFRECDLSLTGEENTKINMILAGLGFTVYRRYRVYRAEL